MVRPRHPVDLDHLDRYTGGDRVINEEILRLFDDQCRELLTKLDGLTEAEFDTKAWHEIAHTLKGAARSIGAFELGDAAAAAEQVGNDRASALAALQRLKQDSAAVAAFIAQLLDGTA